MLTHERNKNPRTKRGCLACYQIGSTGKAFGYIELTLMPMYVSKKEGAPQKLPVTKVVGLCFKHTKEMCDQSQGFWQKTPFGKIPVRDEVYALRAESKAVKTPYSARDEEKTYRSAAPGERPFLRVPMWW